MNGRNAIDLPMPSTQERLLQFSLRGTFLLITGAAFLIAIAVPAIRSLSSEEQVVLSRLTAAFVGTCLILGGIIFWRRYRAEKSCGEIVLVVPVMKLTKAKLWKPQVLISGMMIVGMLLQLYVSLQSSAIILRQPNAIKSLSLSWLPYLVVCLAAVQLMSAVFHFWFRSRFLTTEIGENGLIRGALSYASWNTFTGYSWNASKNVVDLRTKFSRTPIPVSPDHFEQLESILQQHFPVSA
jgi:hypothetical protein